MPLVGFIPRIRDSEEANANVAPFGPYMLFIDASSASGLVPSVAAQVYVTD